MTTTRARVACVAFSITQLAPVAAIAEERPDWVVEGHDHAEWFVDVKDLSADLGVDPEPRLGGLLTPVHSRVHELLPSIEEM